MKLPPDLKKLEELLHSSKLVAGGFLGDDPRPLVEIVEHDLSEVALLGYTLDQLGARMDEITQRAVEGHGMTVQIEPHLTAVADESRGLLICPWHDNQQFGKTVTTATRSDSGAAARWSELSVHLLRAHGFFQGRGSAFRLEPRELISVIFTSPREAPMDTYICKACGYIYDPAKGDPHAQIAPRTPFEKLPEQWLCPMCGAPKRMFKRRTAQA